MPMVVISMSRAKLPVLFRKSTGSFPEIDTIHCFDPNTDRANVILKYEDGSLELECISLGDCEALDADRKFVDVDEVVRCRALQILKFRKDF